VRAQWQRKVAFLILWAASAIPPSKGDFSCIWPQGSLNSSCDRRDRNQLRHVGDIHVNLADPVTGAKFIMIPDANRAPGTSPAVFAKLKIVGESLGYLGNSYSITRHYQFAEYHTRTRDGLRLADILTNNISHIPFGPRSHVKLIFYCGIDSWELPIFFTIAFMLNVAVSDVKFSGSSISIPRRSIQGLWDRRCSSIATLDWICAALA
jgi:hypothetical protein